MNKDPYTVLGVSRNASEDEIKQAYRKLAKQYHPDANPNDAAAAEKMKEINAAYDAIKNGTANTYQDNPYTYTYQNMNNANYQFYSFDDFFNQAFRSTNGSNFYYRRTTKRFSLFRLIMTIIIINFIINSCGRTYYYPYGYYNNYYYDYYRDVETRDF